MLTATIIGNAKAGSKIYKLSDQGGLYLTVHPSGKRTWKYDYCIRKVRRTYTFGAYPEYSLSEVRELHIKARKLVHQGIHPLDDKRAVESLSELHMKVFSEYFDEWVAKQNYADSTLYNLQLNVKLYLLPAMDSKPINQYSALDLLHILQRIPSVATPFKLCSILKRVFNHLLILGLVENNPAQSLSELLTKADPKNKCNFSHITDAHEFSLLLRAIDNPSSRQEFTTSQCLKLAPHVFLRPANLVGLKWQYVNFETLEIIIPSYEMKCGKELIIPMAQSVVDILQSIEASTGSQEYIFSLRQSQWKPLSKSALAQALHRCKRPSSGEPFNMSMHGFRHTASTILNELGYPADAIELQLGHSLGGVRAVYNKSQLMDERRKMMQDYSNYLDGLKSNNNVIPFKKFG